MPRLPTPRSEPKLPEQIFTPESQGAAVARAKGEFAEAVQRGGVQVGQALRQRQSQREISRLNAEFAKSQAALTVEWQETLRTADPNDEAVAETFRENVVKPRIEAMREFANTRESRAYFDRAAAGLGAGFLTTTEAGQRSLRETAAVQNFDTMLNQMGDAVTLDPLSFEHVEGMVDLQLEGLIQSEGLSREKALVLKSQAQTNLAFGAAQGLIQQDPEMGREAVETGRFSEFIDAQQKQRLLAFADSQEAAQEAAVKKAREEAARVAQVEVMREAVNDDGTINAEDLPRLQGQLLRNPNLTNDPASLRATLNFLDQLADDETSGAPAKTDPAVFQEFIRRSALPPGDPNRPTRNEVLMTTGNGLSKDDARFIANDIVGERGSEREEVANALRNDSLRNAAAILTGSATLEFVEDPGKIENLNRFQNFARLRELQLRAEGKSPAEIWAPDGPIMGQLPNFNRRLSLQEQAAQFGAEPVTPGPEPVLTTDPTAFDVPQPGAGPRMGDTFEGKALKELSPAEMQKWLEAN